MKQLQAFLENDLQEDTYAANSAILQDIMQALISRNAKEKGFWTLYIHKIETMLS